MKKKLQIFISSTYIDLIEERQAAVEQILTLGHIPAGMELFAADDEEQLDIIKKWIDESDIYMLILAGRYGSIEKNSGKSYTHLEYEYALSKKKPFFAIVANQVAIDKKVEAITYQKAIELDNPKDLKEFKTIVKSKMVGFYDDCKDIKVEVGKSINMLLTKYDFTGWISGKIMDDYQKLKTEFDSLKSKFVGLDEEHKQKENLKNNELEITTSGSYIEMDSSATDILQIAVVNGQEQSIKDAHILLIAHNNTYLEGKTNKDGICSLTKIKQVGKPYSIYVAHPEYCAFFLDKYDLSNDLIITMADIIHHGSVIFPNRQGYIRSLKGRLNPILDTNYRMYLYADNIAIDGGKGQPVSFKLGQKLELEDSYNNKVSIVFLRYAGTCCLIEYIESSPVTWYNRTVTIKN